MNEDQKNPVTKRQRVIDAAAPVFLRLGFVRTTMGDLARAAGMSRPALYLLFCSKEDVFEAVVAHWTSSSLARIDAALPTLGTLQEKLQFACETWCVDYLELALANPVVHDMSALPPVTAGYARFEDCLTEIIDAAVDCSVSGFAAADVAGIIVSSMQGFKQRARSVEDMRDRIAVLVRIVVRALEVAA